jgi:hypothetical protein
MMILGHSVFSKWDKKRIPGIAIIFGFIRFFLMMFICFFSVMDGKLYVKTVVERSEVMVNPVMF